MKFEMKFQMSQTNSNTCNVHGAVIQVCQAPKGPVKKSDFGLRLSGGLSVECYRNVKSEAEGMGPAARCWRRRFDAGSTRPTSTAQNEPGLRESDE
jgi:hypothetical protein